MLEKQERGKKGHGVGKGLQQEATYQAVDGPSQKFYALRYFSQRLGIKGAKEKPGRAAT